MKVLIACEYSGTVRDAFFKKGHEVLSCDLLPSDAPGPHYTGSVFDVIDYPWDFGGFHFPCTDGSVSGARHFAAKKMDGRFYASASLWMNGWRRSRHIKAGYFEHPVSVMSSVFRKPDQILQPWMFGHYETKATCLWYWGDLPPPGADLSDRRRMPGSARAACGHEAGGTHPPHAALGGSLEEAQHHVSQDRRGIRQSVGHCSAA